MKQTIVTKAIIKKDQKVLLLRRSTGNEAYVGKYELPGGKVDFGEDPKAALQREVAEEIGCEIETLQLFDIHSLIDRNIPDKQYIIVVFLASLKPNCDIRISNEHNKYTWELMSNIQLNEVNDITRTALSLQEDSDQQYVTESQNIKFDDLLTTQYEKVIIYCDGGSRGNPGPSASGYVIFDEQERMLFEGGKYLGITTNNQAEYQAVKFALEKALELGARSIQFRLDSQLVVNQLTGVYQIRNRDLWPIHAYIKELLSKFEKVTFTHVRREFNKEADAMVNKILNERM